MRRLRIAAAIALAVALPACNQMTVQEVTLSNRQKVAMISTPGDGVSPPTNVVLVQGHNGHFAPVASGFGQAPVPALLNGAVAGAAVGTGIYAGARAIQPSVTNVTAAGGAGGQGGAATSNGGGSAFASGGSSSAFSTSFGGSAISTNTNVQNNF